MKHVEIISWSDVEAVSRTEWRTVVLVVFLVSSSKREFFDLCVSVNVTLKVMVRGGVFLLFTSRVVRQRAKTTSLVFSVWMRRSQNDDPVET